MAIDLSAIASSSAALLPKGLDLARQVIVKLDQKAQYDFRIAHVQYCTNVIKKFCRARTFFVRDEPQFIEDFYVPASIIRGAKTRIEKANLESLQQAGRRSIVTGNGGSGKTVFMRYLLLDSVERAVGYPVFIELRNLNELENVDLEKVIVQFMREHGFPLSEKLALRSLQEGLLVVLLDGFDEVAFSKRKSLERAIKKLGSTCSSQIVLSSRPDMVLEGWDNFGTVRIAPLELNEACELIEKVHFDGDDEIKTRFIKQLRGGLFKSHQYFLSNPLLLSIMLLTYGDSADIPKKFASFYEQAYMALFQKHDALKSGFRRHRKTDLDVYEFGRLFAAFSAITYNKRAFRFSELEAVAFLEQAKRVVGGRDVATDGFLDDARQAVCLLVEDGLDLAFVHRSFQEYFVARFINDADEALQKKYIRQISSANTQPLFEIDNVLKLLYEMAPGLVEDNYLVPGLTRIFGERANRKLSLAGWKAVIKKLFSAAHLHAGESISYSVKNWSHLALILFMANNCVEGRASLRRAKATLDLAGHFSDSTVVTFRNVPARSPFWRDLAEQPGIFSLRSLEVVRAEFALMKIRAATRAVAISDIFSFAEEKR